MKKRTFVLRRYPAWSRDPASPYTRGYPWLRFLCGIFQVKVVILWVDVVMAMSSLVKSSYLWSFNRKETLFGSLDGKEL